MVNKVILIGHLGKDPEITPLQSGKKVATFSLATSEVWRDRETGERRQSTEWNKVVVFAEPLIEIAEKYLKKGAKAYVEGQNQTRKWTGRDGIDRHVTEIVLRPFRGQIVLLDKAEREPAPSEDAYGTADEPPRNPGSGAGAEIDDEIPF